jgi:hypothetical protein
MPTTIDCKRSFEEQWQDTKAQVEIPDSMRMCYFDKSGHMPLYQINNQHFCRYYLRVKGILKRDHECFGCYTLDLSRQGLGLLSPIEMAPADTVQLQLPDGSGFRLEIVRCNRIDDQCFECGARFVL